MYCFRCGKKLPPRVVSCPVCDTPQKRRQRYRKRMILGLFIFLAGAVSGSLFDSVFFNGKTWDHSILNMLASPEAVKVATGSNTQETPVKIPEPEVTYATGTFYTEAQSTEDQQNLVASDTEQTATLTVEANPIEDAEVAAETLNSTDTTVVKADSIVFPAGKLVFDKCLPMVKDGNSCYHGFVSKDLKELVFSSSKLKVNGKRFYQCFIKNLVIETEPQRAFEWFGNVWTPELSPDNKKIVFSSDSSGSEHIFVFDRDTKKSIPLTDGSDKNMMPSISPDGKLIVYVSDEKGSNNIWITGIDGENKIQITHGLKDDREPRWLPDGKGIVFTRIYERLKKSAIMKISLDPVGEPEILVNQDSRNWLADMAPDSSALAFVRSEAGDGSKNTIFIKYINTGQEISIKPLGNTEYFRPVWLSDCSGLVFHANINRGKNIYKAVFKRE